MSTAAIPQQPRQTPASLFQRAGGPDACRSLAETVVAFITDDDLLADKFGGVDLTRHRVQLGRFFAAALGGAEPYERGGRTLEQVLEDAHMPLDLADHHFDRLGRITLAALWLHHNLTPDLIEEIFGAVAGLREYVVADRIRGRREAARQ
jgi:truncated hemoglobin YjbI